MLGTSLMVTCLWAWANTGPYANPARSKSWRNNIAPTMLETTIQQYGASNFTYAAEACLPNQNEQHQTFSDPLHSKNTYRGGPIASDSESSAACIQTVSRHFVFIEHCAIHSIVGSCSMPRHLSINAMHSFIRCYCLHLWKPK